MSGHDPRRAGPAPASVPPMTALPPPPAPRREARCPATTRHTPPHSVFDVGVQCKFTDGHHGEHAGHSGFGAGDIFWAAAALCSCEDKHKDIPHWEYELIMEQAAREQDG